MFFRLLNKFFHEYVVYQDQVADEFSRKRFWLILSIRKYVGWRAFKKKYLSKLLNRFKIFMGLPYYEFKLLWKSIRSASYRPFGWTILPVWLVYTTIYRLLGLFYFLWIGIYYYIHFILHLRRRGSYDFVRRRYFKVQTCNVLILPTLVTCCQLNLTTYDYFVSIINKFDDDFGWDTKFKVYIYLSVPLKGIRLALYSLDRYFMDAYSKTTDNFNQLITELVHDGTYSHYRRSTINSHYLFSSRGLLGIHRGVVDSKFNKKWYPHHAVPISDNLSDCEF